MGRLLPPPRPVPGRGRRDVIVDITLIVLAAGFSVLTSGVLVGETHDSAGALIADQVVAGLACGALWWRRSRPVPLALAVLVVGVPSHFMAGPAVVSFFTVAVHCRPRTVVLLAGLVAALMPLSLAARPESRVSDAAAVLFETVVLSAVIGWGLTVRYRRRLLASLYEQAQRSTREAIAREMHDVLAHRLSLLSIHAGALEYHPDAPPEEIRRAAGVIRASAHLALEELRDVIGVLRAGPGGPGTPPGPEGDRPQPTLADLARLAEESRRAGAPVLLDQRIGSAADVPAATGRTAYRVVQEGLTNARKHAPGAEARVTVGGAPGRGLTVEIRNRPGARPGERIPGAGQGLTGLAERVSLAGGSLEHGRTGGDFLLRAWLPWPA
ncbi:sensor histidine kinase [Streptomyces sp. URMC 129]|uniref:sensor histidine kinase n=1 Tax=Streptomyces sp. URMC 129 TaxID=3423407 RepID=UPI003F1E3509